MSEHFAPDKAFQW